MANKEIALSYLKKGLSVIPLWSPEILDTSPPKYYTDNLKKKLLKNSQLPAPQPDDEIIEKAMINQCKVPLIAWKEYQSRRPTEAEVRDWFTKWPDANIGIVTRFITGDGLPDQQGFLLPVLAQEFCGAQPAQHCVLLKVCHVCMCCCYSRMFTGNC